MLRLHLLVCSQAFVYGRKTNKFEPIFSLYIFMEYFEDNRINNGKQCSSFQFENTLPKDLELHRRRSVETGFYYNLFYNNEV